MADSATARVDVRWLRHDDDRSPRAAADSALGAHALDFVGPGAIRVGRICPACGSDQHGRPWLRHNDRRLAASLSRSGPHVVTVIADRPTGLGVDVEHIADVAGRVSPDQVRHPDDPPTPDAESLTRMWVAKEAILKAEGTGLRTQLTEIPVVQSTITLVSVAAPPGFVAAVALHSHRES